MHYVQMGKQKQYLSSRAAYRHRLTVYKVLLSVYYYILDILIEHRKQYIVPTPTIYRQEIAGFRQNETEFTIRLH